MGKQVDSIHFQQFNLFFGHFSSQIIHLSNGDVYTFFEWGLRKCIFCAVI